MTIFSVFIKRCFRTKIFIIALLFMPAISIVLSVFGKNIVGEVKAGVYAEGQYGKTIIEELKKEKNFKFIEYSDIEKMATDVNISELNIGYVFDMQFESDIEKLKLNKSIRVIKSKSSDAYTYLNDIVYTKVLHITSRFIANNFIAELGIKGDVDKYYNDILDKLTIFDFNYIEFGNEKNESYGFELQNFFVSFVLIGGFLGAITSVKDKSKNITKGVFYNILAHTFLLTVSMFVALMIIGEINLFVIFKGFIFMIVSTIFSFLFTYIKNVKFLYGIVPIVVVFSFIMGFVNMSTVGFIYNILKWIMPTGLYSQNNVLGMVLYVFIFAIIFVASEVKNLKTKDF